MSTVKFKVVQKTGSFENKEGQTKKTYIDLGVVFENDKGHTSMKLNALPLANEKGEVWMQLFPIEKQS